MTSRADDFNRTDDNTALGTPSDAGSNWVQASGTFGILSSQAYPVASPTNHTAYLEASAAIVTVGLIAAVVNSTTATVGPVARQTDDSNYLLYFPATAGGGIYKKDTGSYSLLSGFSTTPANGNQFDFDVDSSNLLSAFQNSSPTGSVTDSFNASATKHGFWLSGVATTDARVDDFSITDNTPAGGTTRSMGFIFG